MFQRRSKFPTEVKLANRQVAFRGFKLGPFQRTTVLRLNDNAEWAEHGEIVINDRPPQRMMD